MRRYLYLFLSDERPVNALVPVQEKPVRTAGSGEEFRKVYQSKNTEAAVIITASGVSVSSVEHLLKTGPTFLDLNNFGKYVGSLFLC